jgi:Ca-activated chloride channel homolog
MMKKNIASPLLWALLGTELILGVLYGVFVFFQADILLFLGIKPSSFRFEHLAFYDALPFLFVWAVAFMAKIYAQNAFWRGFAQTQTRDLLRKSLGFAPQYLYYLAVRLCLLFLLLAMANPQYGLRKKNMQVQGVDISIALDVSKSMDAIDQGENFSRLERAKMALNQMINKLKGDRLSLVVFAGDAYVQLPLTADYLAAKSFIQALNTDMVSASGTNLAEAIAVGLSSFDWQDKTSKAIILITDGEDHQGGLEEVLAQAKEKSVLVHAIGIGSLEGVPIPNVQNGKVIGYKTDKNGQTVVSKLDESTLQSIAGKSGGIYLRAQSAQLGLDYLWQQLAKMEKTDMQVSLYDDYQSYYAVFLAVALFFMFFALYFFKSK